MCFFILVLVARRYGTLSALVLYLIVESVPPIRVISTPLRPRCRTPDLRRRLHAG